jgi:hypothetical protein
METVLFKESGFLLLFMMARGHINSVGNLPFLQSGGNQLSILALVSQESVLSDRFPTPQSPRRQESESICSYVTV